MDFIPKDKILEVKPDTLQYVRKMYNLEKPGSMKDAINILNEWIQKQSHFNKKDFSNFYLETSILASKGSMERAKLKLDKLFTLRTLLPQIFGKWNFKTDFRNSFEIVNSLILPKMTDDYYRVYICKFRGTCLGPSQYMNLYRMNLSIAEYVKSHDYVTEYIMIADFTEADLLDYVMKISFIDLKNVASIAIGGFGLRLKGIHIVTRSKFVDKLITILKQVLSSKLGSRIYVHQNIEDLSKIVPKHMLPKDYGGEERSLKSLQEDWLDVISTDEHLSYMRDMNTASTNESCRETDKFTELYAGTPGTFRYFSID